MALEYRILYTLYMVCLVSLPLLHGSPITYHKHDYDTRVDQTEPQGTKRDQTDTRDQEPPVLVQAIVEQEVSIEVEYNCSDNHSCYPEGVNYTIPSELVWCSDDGICNCLDCFYNLNDTCAVLNCHHYDNESSECVDDRKSQKVVFLLSVFLSSMGVANLAIGQTTLGYAQFGIFLLMLYLLTCIFCTKKCFIECCKFGEEECDCYDCCEDFWSFCHEVCATLCMMSSLLGVILCALVIIAWWVADITAFVENSRLDGDGCTLKSDL